MVDYPQHHNSDAVRVTASDSVALGHNDFYPFYDPQMTSTRSGSSNARFHFPPPNMVVHQGHPPHSTLPASSSTLAYGQGQPPTRQGHELSSTQQATHGPDTRDVAPASFYHDYHRTGQHRATENQGLFSPQLLQSPNWSIATTNLGSGRSLSASQLEDTNSGDHYISDYTNGRSSTYVGSYGARSYRHYRDHTEHDAGDEGSDTMSDGIASDETVYSWSGSDRDAFDDEDEDGFEVDSDEEHDSDEYSNR